MYEETGKVTLKDVLLAIRKNGKKFARRYFFIKDTGYAYGLESGKYNEPYDPEKIEYACALGQAALNLNIHPYDLYMSLGAAAGRIVHLNDYVANSYDEVVDSFLHEWLGDINKEYPIRRYHQEVE